MRVCCFVSKNEHFLSMCVCCYALPIPIPHLTANEVKRNNNLGDDLIEIARSLAIGLGRVCDGTV